MATMLLHYDIDTYAILCYLMLLKLDRDWGYLCKLREKQKQPQTDVSGMSNPCGINHMHLRQYLARPTAL